MAEPYRVLVTGSRAWPYEEQINVTLSLLWYEHPAFVLVHGACPRGADRIANWWAWHHRAGARAVTVERHPADWDRHGKRAGILRNVEMVALGADVCLAFILDGSPGASHCATAAERAGIPTRRFERFSDA